MEWGPERALDVPRLVQRMHWYGRRHDVQHNTLQELEAIIASPAVQYLISLPEKDWFDVLVNDAYKASMHKMYATHLSGVTAEFALHIRHSPISLQDISQRHPALMQALQAKVDQLHKVSPYSPDVQKALQVHMPQLQMTEKMICRADMYGVARPVWSARWLGNMPEQSPQQATTAMADAATAKPTHTLPDSNSDAWTGRSTGISAEPASAPAQSENGAARTGTPAQRTAPSNGGNSSVGASDEHVVAAAWEAAFMEQVSEECNSGVVAPWTNWRYPDCSCIAAGAIEAASHTETTVMQLVQEAIICAQVFEIHEQHKQRHGDSGAAAWPDRTELLASCMAHLGHVIDRLNSEPHNLTLNTSLFAGRRASDRLFLIMQNLAFKRLVKGYQGTSSIYAAAMLGKAWDALDVPADARQRQLGMLQGTHAHEMSSVMQQLLADQDVRAGQAACKQGPPHPIPLSSLLAHLLFLTTSGDLQHATALPDTFGTPAWLAVAMAADVPAAFAEYMRTTHGQEVPAGAKCFDLFRIWRIDSGTYSEIAELVVSAWEQRCKARSAYLADRDAATAPSASSTGCAGTSAETSGTGTAAHEVLPRPILMHSNFSSVEEVLQAARLPERIRPQVAAFGTLADGFFPLQPPNNGNNGGNGQAAGQDAQEGFKVDAASLVMKAVQARAPKVTVTQVSAVKAGDLSGDTQHVKSQRSAHAAVASQNTKLEMDPRLMPASVKHMQQLVADMRLVSCSLDEKAVGDALADAYQLVMRDAALHL